MEDKYKNEDKALKEKVDLRKWMQEHPQEYGEVTRDMGEADLFSVFLMGQAAFIASPELHKRLEEMIDLDEFNVDELVSILNESGFAEAVLTNPGNDADWEKYQLPFAALLKHGRSTEMVMENIEDAISLTDSHQAKWQLANFLWDFIRKEVENDCRTPDDLMDYLEYRKAIYNGNIAEWAIAGIEEEPKSEKPQVLTEPANPELVKSVNEKMKLSPLAFQPSDLQPLVDFGNGLHTVEDMLRYFYNMIQQ